MTTIKESDIKESEVFSKYLSDEEAWLREVQRERGGQVYIETLGEKMVAALALVIQGGDEVAVGQGIASFNMVLDMVREYASEIRSEAEGLESYLEGMAMATLEDDVLPGDLDGDSIGELGFDFAINLYNAILGVEGAIGELQDWEANIEIIDEVYLRKFVGGMKNELVRSGVLEDSCRV